MTTRSARTAGDGVVLLVSHEQDDHLAPVIESLDALGAPWRVLDTAHLPTQASLTMDVGPSSTSTTLQLPDGPLDLATITSVWWRRPQGHELDPAVAHDQYAFTYNEVREAVNGMWASLDVRWVNSPWSTDWATYKGHQLRLAANLGLAVPRTRITSNPDDARAFLDEVGTQAVVFKAFSATEQHWRETRLLGEPERAHLDAVRIAPVIFQEYLRDAVDVRITVVGNQLFPATIRKPASSYAVDVRMDLRGAAFEPTEVPTDVAQQLLELHRRLGLCYGAADFKLCDDGTWRFLEVNPAGQWLWVEERTGQHITDAVAALLAEAP